MLHLTPSPLGDLGLYIDKKYCDAQLRHEIMFWFSKLSLDNENVHSMRFVGKCYARHQGVPSEDKIPFEEYLVLVLIKDHFIIKRMLATWHPYTRASFLCQC